MRERLVIMKLLAPRPGRQQPFYNLTHSTIATCSLFALVCSIVGCSGNLAACSELYHEYVTILTFVVKGKKSKQVDNKEQFPTGQFKGTNVENKKRLEY